MVNVFPRGCEMKNMHLISGSPFVPFSLLISKVGQLSNVGLKQMFYLTFNIPMFVPLLDHCGVMLSPAVLPVWLNLASHVCLCKTRVL